MTKAAMVGASLSLEILDQLVTLSFSDIVELAIELQRFWKVFQFFFSVRQNIAVLLKSFNVDTFTGLVSFTNQPNSPSYPTPTFLL